MEGFTDFDLVKEVIGREAALKLVEQFPGAQIYIPKKPRTDETHKRILEDFQRGADYRELSRKYGYSVSHIRRITRPKTRTPLAEQGRLF